MRPCLSHCGNMVMWITLWRGTNVCHIATIWLWVAMVSYGKQLSNMVNYCQLWSTTTNHGHGQPRSTIVMFVTLRQYGYLCHIVCLSYKAMFITLRQYGYVLLKATTWLCLSQCDVCITLWRWGYIHHIAMTRLCSWDNETMFITLIGNHLELCRWWIIRVLRTLIANILDLYLF